MRAENLTLFFIVQRGSLSLRARFLALSIRKFLGNSVKVVAAVPSDEHAPDDDTVSLLKYLGVEIVFFEPAIWKKYNYPIGNKLDASVMPFSTEFAAFLDTDTIFLKPVDFKNFEGFSVDVMAARMMGAQTFKGSSAILYEEFSERSGVIFKSKQAERKASDGSERVSFPMYNSGVVFYRTATGFAQEWRDATVEVLESKLPCELKFPFADQASLSIVLGRGKLNASRLPEGWNVPPSSKKSATLLHYFRFPAALQRDESRWVIANLHKEAAALGYNALGELTLKDLVHFKS